MWAFWLTVGIVFITLSSAIAVLAFMVVFGLLLCVVVLWLGSLAFRGIRYVVIRYSA